MTAAVTSGKPVARAALKPRWSYRSAVLSADSDLSAVARLVLVCLDQYRSDKCPTPFPSQAALCDDSGLKERTVRNALLEGVHKGWIKRVPRWKTDGSGGRLPDAYDLLIPDGIAARHAGKVEDGLPAPTADKPEGVTGKEMGGLPASGAPGLLKVVEVVHELETESVSSKRGRPPTWLSPFLTEYQSAGIIPPGRLAAAVAPVREAEGDDASLASFGRWVHSPEVRFGPEWWAANCKQFLGNGTAKHKPTQQDRNFAEIERGRAEMEAEDGNG